VRERLTFSKARSTRCKHNVNQLVETNNVSGQDGCIAARYEEGLQGEFRISPMKSSRRSKLAEAELHCFAAKDSRSDRQTPDRSLNDQLIQRRKRIKVRTGRLLKAESGQGGSGSETSRKTSRGKKPKPN